jgi:hypothetical protein
LSELKGISGSERVTSGLLAEIGYEKPFHISEGGKALYPAI